MTRSRTTAALLAAAIAVLALASCSGDSSPSSSAISGNLSELEPSGEEQPEGVESQNEQTDDAAETAPTDAAEAAPGPTEADDAAPGPTEADSVATPLPVDPAVRIGTLDNGLTSYLRHNDKPGGSLNLRLIVNVGSINDPMPGAGIAHFVEHMVFNGTEAFPANALDTALRDLGVEIGPDVNAYTSYDETAYELTVNTHPAENVPTVFHALSQMAHAATLDPDAVEAERGVMLDELRLATETSYGYIASEFDRIYVAGTPYEGRGPGGDTASLEAVAPGDLKAYYETWYVPSNMAVVAVGDWPVEDLEALVTEYFGAIPAAASPPFVTPAVEPRTGPSTFVVTDEGQGFSYISFDIPIPVADAGTVEGERQRTMERLIEAMLLNRLEEAYHRGEIAQVDPPSLTTFDINRRLRYYGTNWQGDDLDEASTDYLSVLLTAQEHGFTESDAQRAAKQLAVRLQFELDGAATTQDPQYASLYQAHFLRGADIGTAEDRHDRISALLAELTVEELTEHYRWLMERAGPIVIAVGPDPASVPATEDLDAAIAAAAPGPPPPDEPDVDQLMAAPRPVDPVSSGPLTVLNGSEWEFANGARVMFAPSDIAEGTVSLEARSLGGWSLLAPGDRALSPRAVAAVLGSGLGDLTKSQVNRFLEEGTAAMDAFIGETVEGFSGRAGRDDVETLFQLLHLLVTVPRVDDTAVREAVNEAENRTSLAEVNPAWQAWVAYNEARYDEAWHRPVATREQLDSITAESLLSLFKRRLSHVDDMVVAVVGDIEASEIERLARLYIGTLPAGDSDTYADRRPAMPDGVVQREVPIDEGESAVLEVRHEAEGPVTPSSSVAADMLRAVLDARLFLVIREELGASYQASADIHSILSPRPGLASEIVISGDPDQLDGIRSRLLAILDEMAAGGFGPDALEQAQTVVATDYSKVSNADLAGVLTDRLHLDDDDLLTPQRRSKELSQVSADNVRALAAALYGEGGRIEIVRRP